MNFIIKKILYNEKGAIAKIYVTLLLILAGVGGLVGLSSWQNQNIEQVQIQSIAQIEAILNDNPTAAGSSDIDDKTNEGNHYGQNK